MQNIGFIGLGIMGKPMAYNLVKAGYTVHAFVRSHIIAEEASDKGIKLYFSSADVATQSDIIITMLPNSPQVVQVVSGQEGILEGAKEGAVIIDMSTIAPEMSRRLAVTAEEAGVHFLDAPVSGGSQGAENGTLTIMVGGEKKIFEQCLPVLNVLGKEENIFYVGPHGSGEVVKIANNMLCGAIAAATAEALVLGTKAGADLETMTRIIGVSSGASWQLANQFPLRVFNGSFKPGFMTDLLHKDLGLALDLAAENEVPVPLTALIRQMYEMVRASGYQRDDYTSIVKVLEKLVGVEVRM